MLPIGRETGGLLNSEVRLTPKKERRRGLGEKGTGAVIWTCTKTYKFIQLYDNVQVIELVQKRTSRRKCTKTYMKTKSHAVLIADVVESSGRKNIRAALGKGLELATKEHRRARWIDLPYAITAGDEFQVLLAKGANIPELIFDLRVKFWPLQLRIGVGIGSLKDRIQKPVNRMGGEAFQRARRAIEAIQGRHSKYEVLTAFRTGNERFDATANLIYALQDTLLLEGSGKQWNTMRAFQVAGGVRGAARRMRLDESTVSRNLKRGYFWQMQDAIAGLQKLIEASKL